VVELVETTNAQRRVIGAGLELVEPCESGPEPGPKVSEIVSQTPVENPVFGV
jgi:hypothetical protein